MTVVPTNAQVAEKDGSVAFTNVEGEDGKFVATVEYQQQLKVVSTLVGYDTIDTPVTIEAADDKAEIITMTKTKVRLL